MPEPVTYTHPDVFTTGVRDGWAENITDPAAIDWPVRLARSAIPYEIVNGRPVNPCETTAVRYGRNDMGFWGENLMADALVTHIHAGNQYLLMIERGDGHGWAVPGGHVEPGEEPAAAALRELHEETGLDTREFPGAAATVLPARYVPDPRASDEAWAVTVPMHIDLGEVTEELPVTGRDDARRAGWLPCRDYQGLAEVLELCLNAPVFAAHVPMLREFLKEQQ